MVAQKRKTSQTNPAIYLFIDSFFSVTGTWTPFNPVTVRSIICKLPLTRKTLLSSRSLFSLYPWRPHQLVYNVGGSGTHLTFVSGQLRHKWKHAAVNKRETLGKAREAHFCFDTCVIVTSLPLFQPCLTEKIKVEWTSTSLLGCGNISQTGKTSSGPTTGTILDLLIRTNSDKLWLDLVSRQVCKLLLFWMVEGSSWLWECWFSDSRSGPIFTKKVALVSFSNKSCGSFLEFPLHEIKVIDKTSWDSPKVEIC